MVSRVLCALSLSFKGQALKEAIYHHRWVTPDQINSAAAAGASSDAINLSNDPMNCATVAFFKQK